MQHRNHPVDDRWKAYKEAFPKLNWIAELEEKPRFTGLFTEAQAPATSSGTNPTVQTPATSSGIKPNEKILSFDMLADEFTTKNSPLTVEQRENIIHSVDITGVGLRQAKAIIEAVEKTLIIQQKGFGLRQDGEARLRAPTAFEKYYDTVKTIQSRKEAVESFKRQTEASQAQQADRSRLLQSKRLNLNTVTVEELEAVMPSLPKLPFFRSRRHVKKLGLESSIRCTWSWRKGTSELKDVL